MVKSNITSSEQIVKRKQLRDLLPQLKGMKGGDKDLWLREHQDIWLAMYEIFDFQDMLEILHTNPETLAKHLKEAEGTHRPLVTRADKAMLEAKKAVNTADASLKESQAHAEVLQSLSSELGELKDILIQHFEYESKLNTMTAGLISNSGRTHYVCFTEHIGSANPHKVVLTPHKRQKKTVRLLQSGRLSVSLPVSHDLTGAKGKTIRHKRHSPLKRRWPNV